MATAIEEYRGLVSEFLPRPIRSEREYRRVLKYIEHHIQPKLPKAQGMLLELLSTGPIRIPELSGARCLAQRYPGSSSATARRLESRNGPGNWHPAADHHQYRQRRSLHQQGQCR